MVTPRISADGKTLTCSIRGDLTSTRAEACARQLGAIIKNYEQGRWKKLSIDLNSARMVDSAGLNVLVKVIGQMAAQNRGVKILVSSPTVERALQFTRLSRKVDVVMRTRRQKRSVRSAKADVDDE